MRIVTHDPSVPVSKIDELELFNQLRALGAPALYNLRAQNAIYAQAFEISGEHGAKHTLILIPHAKPETAITFTTEEDN